MKRRGIFVTPPEAHRHETPQRAHEIATERTADILKAWHWELSYDSGVFEAKRDPFRDLAESCYLQGVADAGAALALTNAVLPRPLARIHTYGEKEYP